MPNKTGLRLVDVARNPANGFPARLLVYDPPTVAGREELLKEVADLASWGAVRRPERVVRERSKGGSGLTGTQLLDRARRRILEDNEGKVPTLLDPFAGGGAIPLEGLRLGCEVEASDLNPVAVLILKGTLEYPQKYGQPNSREVPDYIHEAAKDSNQSRFTEGDLVAAYEHNPLATDVRYWGNWMLEKARKELAEFYPPDPDGSVPVAYLWSRTIPCPSCNAEIPTIRQYWLVNNEKKQVYLEPVIDQENNRVDFEVCQGPITAGNPAEATSSGGDARCLLCKQVVKADQVHNIGGKGQIGARLIAVATVRAQETGKHFRKANQRDKEIVTLSEQRILEITSQNDPELSFAPNEPLAYHPQYMLVREYGLDQWGMLFTSRQILCLATLNGLVKSAHSAMLRSGLEPMYSVAIATYLGLAMSRLASENSTLARWNVSGQKVQGALGLQALPMVWDFAEVNPWGGSVGDAFSSLELASSVIQFCSKAAENGQARVLSRDARRQAGQGFTSVITDPPYYDSINYGDISDFFYVWLKRSIGILYPDLLSLPGTPKRNQIVMNIYSLSEPIGDEQNMKSAALRKYVEGND